MATTWHGDAVKDGILHVRIDQVDRPVNAFSRAALEELSAMISQVRRDPTIRGVLFRSGKPGNFIAGADVHELKDLKGTEPARELSQLGQRVFQELAELSIPTVALISGACLGGGLEFALACTYRIADNERKTLLGLPEVKLGLIPGWGGTVRLPRRVGLPAALPIILTGEMVNARQARAIGLVDDVVPTEALETVGEQVIRRQLGAESLPGSTEATGGKPLFPPRRSPLWRRWIEQQSVARKLALRVAERQIERKTHGHYPAPVQAIKALRAGTLESAQAGFAAESAAVAELAAHPVTTELMRLFFLREDVKKPPSDLAVPIVPDSISSAAVIGAGQMGAGIARIMAERGIWVRLKDVKPEYVSAGLQKIRALIRSEISRKRISSLEAQAVFDHLSPTTDYRGLRHADIVIEAVLEDVAIKQQVFRELAQAAGPRTVLATNTSSLLVRDIAAGVAHPDRIVGLHFFNPPHQMPLVEVVRTDQTSPESLATALALVQRIGKTAVVVRDCAGFLVNRLLVPYLNEAGYLLAEVADPMEIERAALEFGFPMGPLELTDLVGVDVAAHVAENMARAYGTRMEPADIWQRLQDLRRKGNGQSDRLIVRSWRGQRRLNTRVGRALAQIRHEHRAGGSALSRDTLVERLVYPVINEAARCLDEGIVQRPEHIDLAMVFGTGFAPFRGGPLRYADRVGLPHIVETLDRLAASHPRLAPCEALRRRAAEGIGFLETATDYPPAAVA